MKEGEQGIYRERERDRERERESNLYIANSEDVT